MLAGQWETVGHTIQTQAHKRGDYGRQAEARPREGGRTIQHRHTCGEKKRQGEARPREGGHTTQAHMWGTHAGRQWETRGDKGGQDLGKADAPSNKGKSAHTALVVKACLLGGNSYTKCSITFVNIAVAISALAGGGQKRFRTETRIRWCFRHFSRIFECLSARGY